MPSYPRIDDRLDDCLVFVRRHVLQAADHGAEQLGPSPSTVNPSFLGAGEEVYDNRKRADLAGSSPVP